MAARKTKGSRKPARDTLRKSLSFRARDELHAKLQQAAASNGRSISEEIEHCIELVTVLRVSSLDPGDLSYLTKYFRAVQTAAVAAGRDQDKWRDYRRFFPFGVNLDDEHAVAVAAEAVWTAVDADLRESLDYLEKHGPAPADDAYRKLPYGMGDFTAARQMADHKFHGRRAEEITGNRKAMEGKSK